MLKGSRENLPLDELFLLLDEINSNAIGFKSSGVITITYGVVANVSFIHTVFNNWLLNLKYAMKYLYVLDFA